MKWQKRGSSEGEQVVEISGFIGCMLMWLGGYRPCKEQASGKFSPDFEDLSNRDSVEPERIVMPIATVPKDRDVLLICDTYDCGWAFDSGHWDETKETFVSNYIDETKNIMHLGYDYWTEVPKTGWIDISLAPKQKLVILAKLDSFGVPESFVSAWMCEQDYKWKSTGSLSASDIKDRGFTHFLKIKDFEKTIAEELKKLEKIY